MKQLYNKSTIKSLLNHSNAMGISELQGLIWQMYSVLKNLIFSQIVVFALSLIIFLISLYSIIKIFKQGNKTLRFQLIPLAVNTLASLGICLTQTQQQQQYVAILLLLVEIYSYSLLTYAYVILYLRSIEKINERALRKLKMSFRIFSAIMLCILIGESIYIGLVGIKCDQYEIHWWYLGFFLLELPVFILAGIYISKTLRKIKQLESNKDINPESVKLLDKTDSYIKIKQKQANLTLLSFLFSFLFRITAVIILFVKPIKCVDNEFFVVVELSQVITLALIDIGNLLPHIIMPVIFFFIPAYYERRGDSITIEQKIDSPNIFSTTSNYETEQIIRNKYKNITNS